MVNNLVVPSMILALPFIPDIFRGRKGVISNHHAGIKRPNSTKWVHRTKLVNQSVLRILLLKGIQIGNQKS